MIGEEYGKLTVISDKFMKEYGRQGKSRYAVWVRCECGKEWEIFIYTLKRKNGVEKCKSCVRYQHGYSETPEYTAWFDAKKRCSDPSCKYYHNYGGRGITMSEEWTNSFETFLNDMGPKPSPNHSLDRIDNNKGYYKENCQWATKIEQDRNRRTCVYITYKNETLTLIEWSRRLNIPFTTLNWRRNNEWSVERMLTTPVVRR